MTPHPISFISRQTKYIVNIYIDRMRPVQFFSIFIDNIANILLSINIDGLRAPLRPCFYVFNLDDKCKILGLPLVMSLRPFLNTRLSPSSRLQRIRGIGCPVALHTNVAFSPSCTVMSELVSSSIISGGTENQYQNHGYNCI